MFAEMCVYVSFSFYSPATSHFASVDKPFQLTGHALEIGVLASDSRQGARPVLTS